MTSLKYKKIIYAFDTREDCEDLMQYLESEGITWVGGKTPTEWYNSKAIYHDVSQIVVTLAGGTLTYGSKDWYRDHSTYYMDYEKVHWKRKKDISLAEFLGWEEGVEYQRNHNIYKVDGDYLTVLKNDTNWENVYIKTWQLIELRSARKYKPKYYAKIKGWEVFKRDGYYFRWNKDWQTLELGSNKRAIQTKDFIDCCMTKEEWEELGVTENNADFFEVEE